MLFPPGEKWRDDDWFRGWPKVFCCSYCGPITIELDANIDMVEIEDPYWQCPECGNSGYWPDDYLCEASDANSRPDPWGLEGET